MLAGAEEHLAGFVGFVGKRNHPGTFVAAIAKWLLGGFSAGAPVIVFAGLDIGGDRLFSGYDGFGHTVPLFAMMEWWLKLGNGDTSGAL